MKIRFDDNDKDFGGEYPKPGIPADDAWKQMHALLVKNKLTQPVKKDRRRLVAWLVVLFIIAGVGGYVYFNANDNKGSDSIIAKHKNTGPAANSESSNDVTGSKQRDTDTSNLAAASSDIPTAYTANKNYSLKNLNQTIIQESATPATQPGVSLLQNNLPSQDINQAGKPAEPSTASKQNNNNVDTVAALNNKQLPDTVTTNDYIVKASPGKLDKRTATGKFHFGLQWNASFSLKNNSHYFDDYSGGKQYYVWALPAAWVKMDIGKKHGVLFHFNPYKQLYAGKQTVQMEEPWIASTEPDIVTRIIKTRGYDLGLKYGYSHNKKLGVNAGLSYTFQRNVLFAEQAVEHLSGNVLSEKMYAAKPGEAGFKYVRSSYLNWNASLQYDFKRTSVGAGVSQPLQNISADPAYIIKPLNGELYLQYRFK